MAYAVPIDTGYMKQLLELYEPAIPSKLHDALKTASEKPQPLFPSQPSGGTLEDDINYIMNPHRRPHYSFRYQK